MIKELNIKKIIYILILLIAFFIPISKAVIPILIAVTLVLSFLKSSLLESIRSKYYRNNALLLMLFYIFIAFSVFWSDNTKSGLFDLEVKMSLFVFPLIFLNYGNISTNEFNNGINAFIAGNIFSSLICLAKASYMTIQNSESYFYYSDFSPNLHPSYFAMYITFAIAGCVYLLKNNYYRNKIYPIIFIAFFIVIIYFLSSKAGFLGLAVMFPFLIMKLVNKRIVSIIISALGGILLIAFIYKFNNRVSDFIHEASFIVKNDTINEYDSSTADRFKIYKISFNLISENALHGVGAGDVKDELISKYKEHNMAHAVELKLNVHNQYIETLIGQGLIGFVLMMMLFVYPIIYIFKRKNYLLYSFLFLIAFHFLFESMLNTQAGVIYFAFFFCFLNFVNKNNNDKVFASSN